MPPITEEDLFARMDLAQLNAMRPLADVFFDLDDTGLRDEARGALQRNADWLRRWASTRITVAGHGDARGTNEYNLALGERRAAAVRRYLVNLGIDESRVDILSKGEDDPFCVEESEDCWQQNRTAHFTVTAK